MELYQDIMKYQDNEYNAEFDTVHMKEKKRVVNLISLGRLGVKQQDNIIKCIDYRNFVCNNLEYGNGKNDPK